MVLVSHSPCTPSLSHPLLACLGWGEEPTFPQADQNQTDILFLFLFSVVFRSKRNEQSRGSDLGLYAADAAAHAEAIRAGGLLLYWYGIPHPSTHGNLATCIWQSRAAALSAIGGPEHVKAMRLARGAYEYYVLERWVLGTKRGSREVEVRKWEEGEVDLGGR